MAQKRKLVWQKVFLKELAKNPNVTNAIAVAGKTQTWAYECRKRDKAFRKAWDEAIDKGIATLEVEAIRRGRDGIPKGIYHNGELINTELQYSDRLLMFMLGAHRPDVYRVRQEVQHTGKVEHESVITYRLPDNERDAGKPNA